MTRGQYDRLLEGRVCEVAARQPLAADEGRIRILEEENAQLRGRLAKDKEEKAKLNLELEELRFQVESLLKKLRQKGGALNFLKKTTAEVQCCILRPSLLGIFRFPFQPVAQKKG